MAQYISSGLWCKCAAKRAHMHSPHLAHIDKRMHAFFFLIEMCEDWGGLSVAVYRNHSCFTLCSVWTSLWLLYSCTAVHYIHSAYGDAMHVQCRTNGALCVPFDECANSFCWKFSSSFICFRVIYIKPDFFLVYFFFFCRVLAEVLCDVRAHSWETSSSLWSTRLTELSCCGAFFLFILVCFVVARSDGGTCPTSTNTSGYCRYWRLWPMNFSLFL